MSRLQLIRGNSLMMLIFLVELISVSSSVGGVENVHPSVTGTRVPVDPSSTFSSIAPTHLSPIAPMEDITTIDPSGKINSLPISTSEPETTSIISPHNTTVVRITTTTTEVITTDIQRTTSGRRKMVNQQDKKSSSLAVSKSPEISQGDRLTTTGTEEDDLGYSTKSKVSKNGTRKTNWCRNQKHLDQCLRQVPPMPDIGIPSSIEAVQTACKAFNLGMGCVNSWTRRCLKEVNVKLFQESISGAHETFTFLCRDSKFRTAYLQHGECYRRVSPKWDECSRNFIEDMKRFHYQGNTTIHCCIRFLFLKCVTEMSHFYCDRGASEFLQKMAETLIRSTMKYHTPPQCVAVQPELCSLISSSQSLAQIHGTDKSAWNFVKTVFWHLLFTYWINWTY